MLKLLVGFEFKQNKEKCFIFLSEAFIIPFLSISNVIHIVILKICFAGHILEGVISIRLQMDCTTPIEFPFYADKNVVSVRKDTCCHCAEVGAERDKELLKKYQVVLPVCQMCIRRGKQAPKRTPNK